MTVDKMSVGNRIDPATKLKIMNIELPQWRAFMIVAGLALAVILPFIVEGFSVFQLTQVMVYAIAVLGLNLLTGF
ncbi:MAG: hypothetical protein CMH67_11880, partial [Nisaea sp.]